MKASDVRVVTVGDKEIIEGEPGKRLLQSPDDITDLIGICFENGALALLLYAENLSEGFFDLSSGEAGTILQKLRNYRRGLAVVVSEDTRQSTMFREMVREESKAGDFRLFASREEAEAWLGSDYRLPGV